MRETVKPVPGFPEVMDRSTKDLGFRLAAARLSSVVLVDAYIHIW